MYDGRGIANYILDSFDEAGKLITNLQLQKILYFCHVWFLVTKKTPLVRHNFEAWEFGPVLPYIYRDFRENGDKHIVDRAKQLDNKGGKVISKISLDSGEEKLLNKIINFYLHYTAGQLVELTHMKNGPWWNTWNHDGKINPGMQIDNDEIIEFYSSMHHPFTLQ